jgi:hypothetical protein
MDIPAGCMWTFWVVTNVEIPDFRGGKIFPWGKSDFLSMDRLQIGGNLTSELGIGAILTHLGCGHSMDM